MYECHDFHGTHWNTDRIMDEIFGKDFLIMHSSQLKNNGNYRSR
jgi:hypothetical protein